MQMVAKVAAPGLRGVLCPAGWWHLSVPQGESELDGRCWGAALRIGTVRRGVGSVIQKPSGIRHSAYFRRRPLRPEEIRNAIQIQHHSRSSRTVVNLSRKRKELHHCIHPCSGI